MKLSISMSDVDVAFLDEYASASGVGSRSAAVQQAVRLLRASLLAPDYEAAQREWDESGDAELWGAATSDGL